MRTTVLHKLTGAAIALTVAAGCVSSPARADWDFLPESRHHLYQSYAFFVEQHNIVAWRGSGQFWAAVAATIPIVGNNDSPLHPQFVFHFSGNDAMHVNDGGGVFTETLDTRIGFAFEMALPFWELRSSLGYFHESGHVVDGTNDPSLNPLNLGDNVFRWRIMRDFGRVIRAGVTFVPISHAIPDNLISGMDEFVEYFPFGAKEDPHSFSPFAAFGLGNQLNIFAGGGYIYNLQAGVTAGSHFDDKHTHDMRFVIGYYNGPDPRSKYAQFLGAHSEFGYIATMFNL
jgi:hypothetical protein